MTDSRIAKLREEYPFAHIADPLYIVDLDGTLSLTHKRQHLIEGKRTSAAWDAFYDACDTDEPNTAVISVIEKLHLANIDIWIFSGRRAEVRQKTIDWLVEHTSFQREDMDHILTMRDIGDSTEDAVLKKSWYDRLLDYDKARLVAVFDDRTRVVNMWRSLGVPCFQVAPGDF